MAKQLPHDRTAVTTRFLTGGWSSQTRRFILDDGSARVLRTFVKPFFRHHAPGLLTRESSVLALLAGREGVPAPEPIAVDATAEHCDHPSLLRRTGRRRRSRPAPRPPRGPTRPPPWARTGRASASLPGGDVIRRDPPTRAVSCTGTFIPGTCCSPVRAPARGGTGPSLLAAAGRFGLRPRCGQAGGPMAGAGPDRPDGGGAGRAAAAVRVIRGEGVRHARLSVASAKMQARL
ncbi:phosphotransferase family protein [Streptomyces sp. GESEQ-4]|uniref:phosphotransferase family protein n=1 Tax=Streptomyces sp. GESEQ-4 TaxID=2812655 RepID=UPI0035A8C918